MRNLTQDRRSPQHGTDTQGLKNTAGNVPRPGFMSAHTVARHGDAPTLKMQYLRQFESDFGAQRCPALRNTCTHHAAPTV